MLLYSLLHIQGSPQFVWFTFETPVIVETVKIMFQGGFVGLGCECYGGSGKTEFEKLGDFYPEDMNAEQVFRVGLRKAVDRFQLVFNKSTDFFGRVTIYKVDILGTKAQE